MVGACTVQSAIQQRCTQARLADTTYGILYESEHQNIKYNEKAGV